MTASELKAKIATDHTRLRDLENRIADQPVHQRRQFDAMIVKARAEITQLEIQLAGMRDACPTCGGDWMPPGFLVCRPCMREVPFKLYTDHKGAVGHAHARRANKYPPHEIAAADQRETAAARAITAYLRQHGSGAGLLAA